VRTNEKRRQRNVEVKSRVRTALKQVHGAGTKEEAEQALRAAASVLDRAAKQGVLKSGTSQRQKSRLSHSVHKRFS
jgi:small subunit ribosomal protein S20